MPSTTSNGSAFPFLNLPPEIRVIVYRYLLISLVSKPITPHYLLSRQPLGLQTEIMHVNRQIYHEACIVLYSENTLNFEIENNSSRFDQQISSEPHILDYCIRLTDSHPPPEQMGYILRRDISSGGTRSLRSGRSINTTNYSGLIYPHVLSWFAKVNLTISINGFWRMSREHNSLKEGLDMLEKHINANGSSPTKVCSIEIWFLHSIFSTGQYLDDLEDVRRQFEVREVVAIVRELRKARSVEVCGTIPANVLEQIRSTLIGKSE